MRKGFLLNVQCLAKIVYVSNDIVTFDTKGQLGPPELSGQIICIIWIIRQVDKESSIQALTDTLGKI